MYQWCYWFSMYNISACTDKLVQWLKYILYLQNTSWIKSNKNNYEYWLIYHRFSFQLKNNMKTYHIHPCMNRLSENQTLVKVLSNRLSKSSVTLPPYCTSPSMKHTVCQLMPRFGSRSSRWFMMNWVLALKSARLNSYGMFQPRALNFLRSYIKIGFCGLSLSFS